MPESLKAVSGVGKTKFSIPGYPGQGPMALNVFAPLLYQRKFRYLYKRYGITEVN
jgi:hypothetical protein